MGVGATSRGEHTGEGAHPNMRSGRRCANAAPIHGINVGRAMVDGESPCALSGIRLSGSMKIWDHDLSDDSRLNAATTMVPILLKIVTGLQTENKPTIDANGACVL